MNKEYQSIVERIYQTFKTCSTPQKKGRPDGWSIQETLGHLIDSASNNHQRFVRYNAHEELHLPDYDQNLCVQRSQYDSYDFQALLTFWYAYNQFLLHLIKQIPPEEMKSSTIKIGDHPSSRLEQLIVEYFAHMEHHEQQVQRILAPK